MDSGSQPAPHLTNSGPLASSLGCVGTQLPHSMKRNTITVPVPQGPGGSLVITMQPVCRAGQCLLNQLVPGLTAHLPACIKGLLHTAASPSPSFPLQTFMRNVLCASVFGLGFAM